MYASSEERLINSGGGKQTNNILFILGVLIIVLIIGATGIGIGYALKTNKTNSNSSTIGKFL